MLRCEVVPEVSPNPGTICGEEAEFLVVAYHTLTYSTVHACREHVGFALTEATEHRVYRCKARINPFKIRSKE